MPDGYDSPVLGVTGLQVVDGMGVIVENIDIMRDEYSIPDGDLFGGPYARIGAHVTIVSDGDGTAVTKGEQFPANVRIGADADGMWITKNVADAVVSVNTRRRMCIAKGMIPGIGG